MPLDPNDRYFRSFRTVAGSPTGTAVYGYQICTTEHVIFVGLETATRTADGPGHTTVWSIDLFDDNSHIMRLGSITSRPLPPALAAMPYDDDRITAVGAYQGEREADARAAIVAAWPLVPSMIAAGRANWSGCDLHTDAATAREIVGA